MNQNSQLLLPHMGTENVAIIMFLKEKHYLPKVDYKQHCIDFLLSHTAFCVRLNYKEKKRDAFLHIRRYLLLG